MVGDLADIVSRLRSALPRGWFSDRSPNLNAVLSSIAGPWTWLFDAISYTRAQCRLATATDKSLDLVALDFFGRRLSRRKNETDSALRFRIQAELLPDAATRGAICSGMKSIVGKPPFIFEPRNCGDTGSYGSLSMVADRSSTGAAYGCSGGWGNLQLPFQFFITTTRPAAPGVGFLAGYGVPCGGYGAGLVGYMDLSSLEGYVTDGEICATLRNLLPVNTVAWIHID
jgi:hypothetical protein